MSMLPIKGIPDNVAKPVFGMLHLPALPGSPDYCGDLQRVLDAVLRDADTLVSNGVHGLVMENFFDVPFYPDRVPPGVVAQMTRMALEVRSRFDVPLGINVLRNDARASLAVAYAVGAEFIRVNILAGARVTDQGVIQGIAHELLRERASMHATDVKVFADVNVKHSMPLGRPPAFEDEVIEVLERGGADAVIVTGRGTGLPTDSEDVQRAHAIAKGQPVIVGSGVKPETIVEFVPFADAFIVGTSLKKDGCVKNPVDPKRVTELLASLRAAQSE